MTGKHRHDHEGDEQQKQGISSFTMQDSNLVFDELKLNESDFFLDLGCGAGDYSIQAAKIVGQKGKVYAIDQWQEVVDSVSEKADVQGILNISAIKSNIISSLPIEDKIIDACLLAQVLHGVGLPADAKDLFAEISRVLKPSGRLAILEFTKKDVGFGPPMHIRLSPEEIEEALKQYGYEMNSFVDYECSYLIQFIKS
jgi:ubiquinone/menaquinone biosynthesis C-methylase UbiE